MPLTLEIKHPLPLPLEVESVLPETVRGLTIRQIADIEVFCGNATLPLGEFFHLHGSASDDRTVVWQGDCSRVKHIGARMSAGIIRIEGHAGMHLGVGMTSGQIICEGNTDDWLGAEMHGGQIEVQGNAGNFAGSVYRGGSRGMTGGQILIHGDAGHEVGRAMRRGLIAIGGNCGDAVGYAMIAGTIIIAGSVARRPGAAMKRGSIVILSQPDHINQSVTFRNSGQWKPEFIQLYFRELRRLSFPLPKDCEHATFQRVVGDGLELTKGELLIRLTDC